MMNTTAIFNRLCTGEVLRIKCSSETIKHLRNNLNTIKHRSDTRIKDIGMPFTPMTLTISYDKTQGIATLYLISKAAKKSKLEFEIL